MQSELFARRPYGSGRVDRVFGPSLRLLPALGGPSWSRMCLCGAALLNVRYPARLPV